MWDGTTNETDTPCSSERLKRVRAVDGGGRLVARMLSACTQLPDAAPTLAEGFDPHQGSRSQMFRSERSATDTRCADGMCQPPVLIFQTSAKARARGPRQWDVSKNTQEDSPPCRWHRLAAHRMTHQPGQMMHASFGGPVKGGVRREVDTTDALRSTHERGGGLTGK
ncbi:hypothetical protein FKP32DRAFT_1589200 [Trametes sanguinea]|nr:hypothetical protein FKP32DRAFT_1589200 [Trametes sanguinea]